MSSLSDTTNTARTHLALTSMRRLQHFSENIATKALGVHSVASQWSEYMGGGWSKVT